MRKLPYRMVMIGCLIVWLFSSVEQSAAQPYLWPTNASRALTSSFGESRPGRFHAGIDVKTWGKVGYPIIAVRDGYVSRLRVSPFGYGRVVYLTLDTGEVVVYAHLSRFGEALDAAVLAEQERRNRFSIDLWLNKDDFAAKRGDVLGYTGQSGVGFPHLHFEMRDAQGHPINPLSKGYVVDDTLPPTVRGISIQPLDAQSTVENDWRPALISVTADGKGSYRLQKPVAVSGKIAFGLNAFDGMDGITNKFGTYKNQLWIGEQLIFQATYDRFPYSLNQQADLDRDYRLRALDLGAFYKLFRDMGNQLWFYSSAEPYSGAVWFTDSLETPSADAQDAVFSAAGFVKLLPGRYPFRIVTSDYWGNESIVRGELIAQAPSLPAMSPKMAALHASDNEVQFKLRTDYYDHFIRLELQANKDLQALPVLTGWSSRGRRQNIPLLPNGPSGVVGAWNLHRQIAYPLFFELSYWDGAGNQTMQSWILPVIPVAQGSQKTIKSEDQQVKLAFNSGSLYRDLYLRQQILDKAANLPYDFVGRIYRFDPMDVPLNNGIDLILQIPEAEERPEQLGIYTRVGDKRWVFLGNRLDAEKRTITTRVRGLGEFCLIRDSEKPDISGMAPADSSRLTDDRPVLQAIVVDTLSGLKNEPHMAIYLDGVRVIAEYDPESKQLFYRPRRPLAPGRHEMRVVLEDYCGNTSSKTHLFWIDRNGKTN